MKPPLRRQASSPNRFRRPEPRRGVVLVCVLVCVSVAITLATTATYSVLKQRQRLRMERQLRQVGLLIDAGVQLALAKLASDADYRGETWRINAEVLPGFPAASVRIDVPKTPQRVATVVATLPADSATPVRRSHQFPVP